MTKYVHIIGGGTMSHVRSHLGICAFARGTTARRLYERFAKVAHEDDNLEPVLHLTFMGDPFSKLVTNQDVADLLEKLKADPDTRAIILNAALVDFDGEIIVEQPDIHAETPFRILSGKHAPRLKSRYGNQTMQLTPAEKLVGNIRKERKDIFVVAFKTTTEETSDEQYKIALNALKRDSVNLVFANDTVTRNNMIVTPEEARYGEGTDREHTEEWLAKMVNSRVKSGFTRSTVVEGDAVDWNSPLIPENLREVVNHCIEHNAYKIFRNATVGHFAVKIDNSTILTSRRKTDFNKLPELGLVRVEYDGDDRVVAYGAKPSVGGQSQRIIFQEHPGLDCIVHAHSPVKEGAKDVIPVVEQWPSECGSHMCGNRTSQGLKEIRPGIWAVMLEHHGFNVVFRRDIPANDVISFIEDNFDLSMKTGGLVA